MRVVLDTNVLVAGLLSPFGPCGGVVRMVSCQGLTLLLDARILCEYREVLRRPKFQFDSDKVDVLLDLILHAAEQVASVPLSEELVGDPDDQAFLEVAVAGGASALITGNVAHPVPHYAGVRITMPRDFLSYYREQTGGTEQEGPVRS